MSFGLAGLQTCEVRFSLIGGLPSHLDEGAHQSEDTDPGGEKKRQEAFGMLIQLQPKFLFLLF